MSDDETGEDGGYLEPTGSFQPAIYQGIPVDVPGTRARGEYGGLRKTRHPPVTCPNPRYPATMRGFYRCPACGDKAPLAGQVQTAELARERGETLAESAIAGAAQAFWIAVDAAQLLLYGVRLAWFWLTTRAEKRQAAKENGGGVPPEMVKALVVMGMVAARKEAAETVSEAKECLTCDL